jgi:rubredoxin
LAYLEAKVTTRLDVYTHTVFIGTLTEAEVLSQGEPMTYAYYHQIKRGSTPKTAPTFIPSLASSQIPAAPQYRCTICNYIYDPAKGDPDQGVPPGTAFDQLPEDWSCPICGAGKEAFEAVS